MDLCFGNCVSCLKVNFSLFKNLSKEELGTLNKGRKKFFFKKGEFLYKEGAKPEGLICLSHGKVKLIKKGKIEDEFIVGLQKPVDFVGFVDLMGGRNYTSSAIAMEDVWICVISMENLFSVIKGNAELALNIIQDLSEKAEHFHEKLINLSQSHIESRLAFVLKELVEFYGFQEDGKTLAVQFKRKELAAIANMNTANVIRTLVKFKEKKIIDIKNKKIIILDLTELSKII